MEMGEFEGIHFELNDDLIMLLKQNSQVSS